MRTKLMAATVFAGALACAAPAAAQPPTQPSAGCQAFGQNVAGLAQGLGASASARPHPAQHAANRVAS